MSSDRAPDNMPNELDAADYDKDKAIERAVRRAAVAIGAHADTVQIFATLHDDDEGTREYRYGSGNVHARVNQARMWVRVDDADTIRERMGED